MINTLENVYELPIRRWANIHDQVDALYGKDQQLLNHAIEMSQHCKTVGLDAFMESLEYYKYRCEITNLLSYYGPDKVLMALIWLNDQKY